MARSPHHRLLSAPPPATGDLHPGRRSRRGRARGERLSADRHRADGRELPPRRRGGQRPRAPRGRARRGGRPRGGGPRCRGHPGLRDRTMAPGTANMTRGPAMTRAQTRAGDRGRHRARRGRARGGLDLIGTGEMGIGNTTAASAIVAALTGASPESVTGPGTGVDDGGPAAEGRGHPARARGEPARSGGRARHARQGRWLRDRRARRASSWPAPRTACPWSSTASSRARRPSWPSGSPAARGGTARRAPLGGARPRARARGPRARAVPRSRHAPGRGDGRGAGIGLAAAAASCRDGDVQVGG